MTSPRWEGGSSGECAYSQTSNMGGKWKAVPLTAWYRVVCQEAGVPATTVESSIATTVPTTTTSVPATTAPDVTGGNCPKFLSDPALHMTAIVGGVCYYGFNNNVQYATAEALCLSESTQLPDFQVEATQESVYAALGSQYGQHWLGLKKVSGVWKWWDVVTVTGTDMTSPRWEGGSSGECAYSQTSNMGGKWKAVPLTAWYRVVCQEAGVPATTVESSIATTVPTTTTSVPATTAPDVTGGNCPKFLSDPALHMTAIVGGVCYYGFNNNVQYATAEALCLSESTQLPDFQVEATQESVYAALGSQYGQHWLGLKKVIGVWKWWDVVTGTGTDMTSPRWEGGSSGECAYSQTSNMGGKWKAVPLTAWYRVVCQEAGVPATTVESSIATIVLPTTTTVPATTTSVPATTATDPILFMSQPSTTTTVPATTTTVPATTTSVPATTTTVPATTATVPSTTTTVPATTTTVPATTTSAVPASCTRSFDGGVVAATFNKCSTLTGVEETSVMTLTSITRCGRTCAAKAECCSFVFDVTTKACRHFRPALLGTDVIPTSLEKCYTAV
ncbi:integumentary mucin C.1-like [Haliotis rubra]|uniref:integumentary mucin C.1-like n=1 Tax=Haliotis rubra TaxID=36100 RepID=UPI001EE5F5FE|nr:integumentary mucin C.1-like [Haliotis rubra]